MPKHETGFHRKETEDSLEMINRCLNCKIPAKMCRGDKNCTPHNSIQESVEKRAAVDTARYAHSKGYSIRQIQELTGLSTGMICHALYD